MVVGGLITSFMREGSVSVLFIYVSQHRTVPSMQQVLLQISRIKSTSQESILIISESVFLLPVEDIMPWFPTGWITFTFTRLMFSTL